MMELNTIGLELQKTNGQENKAERTTMGFVQVRFEVVAIISSNITAFVRA